MQNTIWDVVVIGGGPAGMMAAGRAGELGKRVLLLEKNAALGTKLLITGGGRCNVTNDKPVREVLARYKQGGKFLASPFSQFAVAETIVFFRERGMELKEESGGRMFPATEKAQSVLDVLVRYLKYGDVTVRTESTVTGLTTSDTEVHIALSGTEIIRARHCIVATGGTSHPETGSTGDGFVWLAKLGHTIRANDMSLVPIALSDAWVKDAAGVTLDDIKLTACKDGVKQESYKGRILFTHVGISGPTVLNMSREVGELLEEAVSDVRIMLDMFPALDHGALRTKLQESLVAGSNKKFKNVLSSLIAPGLVDPLLAMLEVDGETPCHSVRTETRQALMFLLKAIPLHVSHLLGKDKAVVSSGGVALTEIDFKTMRSLVSPRISIAGDLLDIDRPSGGYSLQLCWTTGWVAGSGV